MKLLTRGIIIGLCCICFWVWSSGSVLAVNATDVDQTTELWQESAHALNDVNCSSCHQAEEGNAFIAQPNQTSCQSCHEQAVDTFLLGKHGIRILEGQSPLTPAMARLPMKSESHSKQMTCNACHDVHSVKTIPAARDACLSCHNDPHSLNYEKSEHAKLFAKDQQLPRPSGKSVSCATCHLPRHEMKTGEKPITLVNHNNTYNLLPRDRMVQEVCMNCHGVEYSYNSIFDDDLVEANFDKPPTLKLETFDLVRQLESRRSTSE